MKCNVWSPERLSWDEGRTLIHCVAWRGVLCESVSTDPKSATRRATNCIFAVDMMAFVSS